MVPISPIPGKMMQDYRIPVTLLTGFLGAGKTTLLNAVLSDASTGRVAVIVNEFGEAGLDHDLIESVDDEVVLMRSGCLCCTVKGELAETIAALFDRRNAGELVFDRIVIETTGLADPGPILQTLLVDVTLARAVRMDGVVTVADAANGAATLDAQFEAVSQAAMADLIVISKTDLVAPSELKGFENRLRSINPTARILRAEHGKGVVQHLWGLSGLRPEAEPAEVLKWTSGPEERADPFAGLSGLSGMPIPSASAPVVSPHDSRIESVSIELEQPIDSEAFDRWLDTLIAMRGPDILRVKGIVFLKDFEMPFVFHGVQQIFDPPRPIKDWPKGDTTSRIVVIARDISRPALQRSFDMLRARVKPRADAPLSHKVIDV
jgi:G3E family GTPase